MGKFSDASQRTPKTSCKTFKNRDVYVAKSSYLKHIDELGLIASREFQKGDVIQEYKGKIISDEQADMKKSGRKYMFDVHYNNKVVHVIDAAICSKSSAARYVNSTLTIDDINKNSEFIQYNLKIYLVATKYIPPNHEIISFYGRHTLAVLHQK